MWALVYAAGWATERKNTSTADCEQGAQELPPAFSTHPTEHAQSAFSSVHSFVEEAKNCMALPSCAFGAGWVALFMGLSNVVWMRAWICLTMWRHPRSLGRHTCSGFRLATVGRRCQRRTLPLSCACLSVKALQSVGCVLGLFCCLVVLLHLSAGYQLFGLCAEMRLVNPSVCVFVTCLMSVPRVQDALRMLFVRSSKTH